MLNYTSHKHSPIPEDRQNSHEFVRAIDCLQHLRQQLIAAWSSPRFLDNWYVLYFSLGATGAIGRAKHLYWIGIVYQCMLSGKQYTLVNACHNKDFLEVVEIGEKLSKVSNVLGRDGILMNNIAAVNKGRDTLDNICRNVATDCCNVDLYCVVLNKRNLEEGKGEPS
jgi:hypothetical protein